MQPLPVTGVGAPFEGRSPPALVAHAVSQPQLHIEDDAEAYNNIIKLVKYSVI